MSSKSLMSSPDCKRQKLADNVNSVAKMSNQCVIDVNAQSFKDVAVMEGFVDRTMLIEELLQREPIYVMMFAPSKFGKSVNLTMIRLFCEIEDKNTKTKEDVTKDPTMQELRSNPSENMKVFLRQFAQNECLIMKQEKFVIQHFGRHPVVFFNFKGCTAKNEKDALAECASHVKDAYLENKYLKNSKEFQSDDDEHVILKQRCTDWLTYSDNELESLSARKVIKGLQSLIKSLKIHWGRDPVFLVDEIDKPCVAAMEDGVSEKDVLQIGSTITNVLCSILKSEDEQLKLQAALLTGICKLKSSGLATPMDNTMKVYFLSDDRFSKYYGLTAQEVDSLVRKFYGSQGDTKVNTIIKDINRKYNGYYQRTSSGENKEYARYCLFSVLNYISQINEDTKKSKLCFWTDGGLLTGQLVPILKKSEVVMGFVHKLLYDDSGTIAIQYQPAIDVKCLLGLYREEMAPTPNAIFNFLLQRGYLAHNLEKPEEEDQVTGGEKIHVRIPNREIKNIYHQMFEKYHNTLSEDTKSKFTSCGQTFKSLSTQNSTDFQKSLDKLCKDFKCIFTYMQCENEASICCHILAILKHYADYEKGAMQYAVQYFDNDENSRCVYIDVWGHHDNFAVIFEVKYNSEASSEPGKIGFKAKSSLAAAEDIVKLLPDKIDPEDPASEKAGTGRDLEVLKSSKIKHYVLIGLAVDGDYTTHMLVFRDNADWENVIQSNPENHVAELISTHLKNKITDV